MERMWAVSSGEGQACSWGALAELTARPPRPYGLTVLLFSIGYDGGFHLRRL